MSMILCKSAVLSKFKRIIGLQVEDEEGRLTRQRLKTAFVRGVLRGILRGAPEPAV
jgi:hypothetical protein